MTSTTLTLPSPPDTSCLTGQGASPCPACGWAASDPDGIDRLVVTTRRVKRRETIYRIGDRFHSLYAVRSGTFKSTMGSSDGREQVTGFQMAGDLLGLDALAEGTHATSAVALEDSEITVLPYAQLKEIAAGGTALHQAISRLLSREIVRDHRLMALRGSFSAGEKVAAFLLNMSRHMKDRGYSAREFHLRMSRGEIGSYLGINLETVSRIFSDLQHRGVLEVDKRHVRIADMQALSGMFGRAH